MDEALRKRVKEKLDSLMNEAGCNAHDIQKIYKHDVDSDAATKLVNQYINVL